MTLQKSAYKGQSASLTKRSLDKDLSKLNTIESATQSLSQQLIGPGLATLFLIAVAVLASIAIGSQPNAILIIAAAALGGYMALNIGRQRRCQQCWAGCRFEGDDIVLGFGYCGDL